MKQASWCLFYAGLHLCAGSECTGPAADATPTGPAVDTAAGVVMLATKSVVGKGRLAAHSEGGIVAADTKGIEHEAALIAEVLATPSDGSSEIPQSLLQRLATMKITPQVKAFIKATLATLAPVFGNISEASTNATTLCSDMYSGFDDLTRNFNTTKNRVSDLKKAASTARKGHSDCRTAEDSALAAKRACDIEEQLLFEKTKEALAEVQKQQGAVRQSAVCGPSTATLTVDNDAVIQGLKDKADSLSKATKDFMEAKANKTAKAKECAGLTTAATAKKTECDQKQKDFEAAVCLHGTTSEDGCKFYEGVYDTHLKDYEAVVKSVKLQQADRHTEWKHLKRIQCVLEAIASATAHGELKAGGTLATKIQACYGKPFDNSGLLFATKAAPPQQQCPMVPELPCTASFISQEYDNLPTNAGAATCTNGCGATTTTITTTITTTTTMALASVKLIGKAGPDKTSQGLKQCYGASADHASNPLWADVRRACGSATNVVFAGHRCDGQWVEFDVGEMRGPLRCFTHGNDDSTGCPPRDATRSNQWYWDNLSVSNTGEKYSLYFNPDWWVLGKNGNRWSDPGRCWEPRMNSRSWGYGDGHVLSPGCTNHDQHSCKGDSYYIYVRA